MVNQMSAGLVRSVRRAATGLTFVGVMFAGGVAIGAAGDGADGRPEGSNPGAPSDISTPAPVDSDAGRGTDAAPTDVTQPQQSAADAQASPTFNGRAGGVDPSHGPLPVAAPLVPSVAQSPAAEFDTDSGEAPVVERSHEAAVALAESGPPVDQDVPGSPTGGPAGADLRANDADG